MTLISVPDMNCGHCRASVETALSALPGIGTLAIDLPARQLSISGPAAPGDVLAALDAIGFPATVLPEGGKG